MGGNFMIGLIIVDDEPAIRNTIAEMFDWESMGITLKKTFSNAFSALEMINTDIDIVIADMKMPEMNGIEFMTLAKKRFPWLHFVVLSGYDDFELVKNTFVLGAEDYFLKSELEPEKFENTLKRIVNKIKEKRKSINTKTEPDYTHKAKIIKNILWNNEIPQNMMEEADFLKSCYFRVMILKIPEYDTVLANYFNGEAEALHYGISNILNELIGHNPSVTFFHNIKNEFTIITIKKNKKNDSVNFHQLFKEIVFGFNQYINCITNGGISEEGYGIKSLTSLYSQAVLACDYSYVEGNGILIEYEKCTSYTGKTDIVSLIEDVRQSLNSVSFSNFTNELEYIIPEKGDIALTETENVRHLVNQIFYEIRSFAKKNNIPLPDDFIKNGEKIIACGSASDFKLWIKNQLSSFETTLTKTNSLVNRIITIVHERYHDKNLRLNSIADELGVTYNHLSRLFKQQTGLGFNQYLNDLRMKIAMELLRTSNLKLYEISEKVGYQNYENFSRSFKTYYGTSPKKIYSKN